MTVPEKTGAAYGQHNGIQVFITMRRGRAVTVKDVRVEYHDTVAQLRAQVERVMGVPPANQLLFVRGQELVPEVNYTHTRTPLT